MSNLENIYGAKINQVKEILEKLIKIPIKDAFIKDFIILIEELIQTPSDQKHIVSMLFFESKLSVLFYKEIIKLVEHTKSFIIMSSEGNVIGYYYEEIQLMKNDPILNAINRMINFVWIQFYYSIYPEEKLYELIYSLYQSNFFSIKSKASKLIHQIAIKQSHILEEFENRSRKQNRDSFESLSYMVFFQLCDTIQSIESSKNDNEPKERQVYNYLKNKIAHSDQLFDVLKFYAKTNTKNNNMSIELFERLLKKSMNLNCSSIIFELFEVLEIILRNRRNENFIKNRDNFISLLNKSNEAIVVILKDKIPNFDACKSFDLKKWKIATNFHKFSQISNCFIRRAS